MTNPVANLLAVIAAYPDADDDRPMITATSSSNSRTGERSWTGLTMGDLRAIAALHDTCGTTNAARNVEDILVCLLPSHHDGWHKSLGATRSA